MWSYFLSKWICKGFKVTSASDSWNLHHRVSSYQIIDLKNWGYFSLESRAKYPYTEKNKYEFSLFSVGNFYWDNFKIITEIITKKYYV